MTVFVNIGLGIVAMALLQMFKDSLFADIAKFLFILAVTLAAHSAIPVFLSGQYLDVIYGMTALMASISYLLLVLAILTALKKINRETSQ
jgi:energy-converting hydrogenase Eha subunit C